MIQKVTDRYGDRVSFHFTDSEIVALVGTQTTATNPMMVMADPRSPFNLLTFSLILCSMMLAVLCCLEIRRHRLIAGTGNGAVVIHESSPVSCREISDKIRSADMKPAADLQDRVMRSINESAKVNP